MFVPKEMFTCTEGLKCLIIYNNNKECILVYGKKIRTPLQTLVYIVM